MYTTLILLQVSSEERKEGQKRKLFYGAIRSFWNNATFTCRKPLKPLSFFNTKVHWEVVISDFVYAIYLLHTWQKLRTTFGPDYNINNSENYTASLKIFGFFLKKKKTAHWNKAFTTEFNLKQNKKKPFLVLMFAEEKLQDMIRN